MRRDTETNMTSRFSWQVKVSAKGFPFINRARSPLGLWCGKQDGFYYAHKGHERDLGSGFADMGDKETLVVFNLESSWRNE